MHEHDKFSDFILCESTTNRPIVSRRVPLEYLFSCREASEVVSLYF